MFYLRCFMLIWVVWFFGIFVPSHTRGMVTLPGGAPAVAAACPNCVAPPSESSQENSSDTCACAICHLVANLNVPPVLIFDLPQLWRIDELDLLTIAQISTLASPEAIRARPPPVTA